MNKRFLIFIALFYLCLFELPSSVNAAFLRNVPISIQQPDGQVLSVFASGDEYHYRIHDGNDFTILQNSQGYYVYAEKQGDQLIPTTIIVGQADAALAGLVAGVDISDAEWKQLRADFWENTPARPVIAGASGIATLNTGTLNNIVIYIRFSDQTEFSTSLTTYDNMFNNVTLNYNSMINYFSEVSYNTLSVPSTYYPLPSGTTIVSYQDSHLRNYYVPYNASTNTIGYSTDAERTTREHTLLVNAVNAIASQVPAGLNLDFNNDGYVDNVCFIIKGATTAWSTLLWPHRWSLYSQTVSINGKQVYDYNLQLEDMTLSSGVGVLCHEMFHSLGAPDLYHYTSDGMSPVGGWDIMENNANPPQSMGAWMKYKYGGWISTIPTITTSGTYTLNPITSSTNNVYKLASTNSSTEFFIFEYRRKTGPFENSIPASGLIIYRINTLAGDGNASGPPDEIYIYRLNGTTTVNGTINSANFVAGGRTTFNNTSNPFCFFSDATLAGLNISAVTAANATISFTVTIPLAADFTANKTSVCPGQTIIFTDQSQGGATSWSWAFTPATVTYVDGTSSTSQNPHVQFNASGNYTVALTASGPGGTNTKTKTSYILVQPTLSPTYTDDFESNSFLTNSWTLTNPDAGITWAIKSAVPGNTPGTKSPWLNCYAYATQGAVDYLSTPLLNLSTYGDAQLTFKVAYRPYSSSYHDSLKVQIYNNCGENLVATPYAKTGLTLGTGTYLTTDYTPAAASDWRTETVSLNSYTGGVITLKFKAVNDYGNNIYIDNVNITGTQLVPNFTASATSICTGSNITFTDQSTGGATGWQWNFGDGGTSTTQSPVHSYAAAGVYSVSLTITKGSASNVITKTNYITISSGNAVSVSINTSQSWPSCQSSSVTFTAVPVNGGAGPVYQWKVNGANSGTNSSTFTYAPSNNDIISCVLTSNIACPGGNPATSNTITALVTNLLAASVSISNLPVGTICEGTTVAFTAIPVNGGASPVYQWKVNGINAGTNATAYSYAPANNDQVSCVMTSNASCASGSPATSNIIQETVNQILPVSVSIAGSPAGAVCSGNSVSFTATPTNGGSTPAYQWKVNGTNSGTNSNIFSYVPANNDQISCVLTSNSSCGTGSPATSNSIQQIVNTILPVSISITGIPSGTICSGTSVSFTAVPVNGGGTPVYQWKVNGVNAGTNSVAFSYIPSNNDLVSCVLTSNASCVSGSPAISNTVQQLVDPSLPVTVSISGSPSGTVCPETTVIYTAVPINGGTTPAFQWKVNGSNTGTNANTFSHVPLNGDLVSCVLTSNAVCASGSPATSNTVTMVVNPSLPVTVSISGSPSGAICSGTSVIYTAVPTNGGTTPAYQWKVNGSNTGTNANTFSHVPVNGDLISCVLTSNAACASGSPATSNTLTQVVSASLPVSVSISGSPSGAVCFGTNVIYTAVPTNGGTTPAYQWKVNGSNTGTNANSLSLVPVNGDLVSCVLTSNAACASGSPATSNTVTMVVNPSLPVTVSISGSPSGAVCSGTSVIYTAVPTNGGTTPAYQWKVNGSNTGTNANSFSLVPVNGDIVSCVLTSNAVCASGSPATSNTLTQVVSASLPVSVSISATPSGTVCQGSTIIFTATPQNGGSNPSIQWYRNSIPIQTGALYTTSTLNNNDIIEASLTSNLACTSNNPASSNIIIAQIQALLPLSISISSQPNGPICQGATVNFSASIINGGPTAQVQWFKNGNAVATGLSWSSNTLSNNDEVHAVLSSSELCLINNPVTSNSLALSVLSIPVVNLGNDTIIPFNSTLLLDAGGAYTSYLWSTGATTPSISVANSATYGVTVSNSANCSASDAILVQVGYDSFSGYVYYNNFSQTPLSGVTVRLKQGSNVVRFASTNSAGFYTIDNYPFGNYTVDVLCMKPWGGVNSTDALLILKHYVGMIQLTGVRLLAADVVNNGYVNTVDALAVQKRFIGSISTFPAGDWYFENPYLVLDGSISVTQDIKGLCYGDADGSYNPPAKSTEDIQLVNKGELSGISGQSMNLPVRVNENISVAAISLSLTLENNQLNISGILGPDGSSDDLVWSRNGNSLSISWVSLSPVNLQKNDALITIICHSNESPSFEAFTPFSSCSGEIVDFNANKYDISSLSIPSVHLNGIDTGYSVNCAPNPFSDNIAINFATITDERFTLSILDPESRVLWQTNEVLTSGKHTIYWDGTDLSGNRINNGVYFLKVSSEKLNTVIRILKID